MPPSKSLPELFGDINATIDDNQREKSRLQIDFSFQPLSRSAGLPPDRQRRLLYAAAHAVASTLELHFFDYTVERGLVIVAVFGSSLDLHWFPSGLGAQDGLGFQDAINIALDALEKNQIAARMK